jgi:hypothetical protein
MFLDKKKSAKILGLEEDQFSAESALYGITVYVISYRNLYISVP